MPISDPPSISRDEGASHLKRRPRVPIGDLLPAMASRAFRHKPPSEKIAEIPDVFIELMKLIQYIEPKAKVVDPKVLMEILDTYQMYQDEHQRMQMFRKKGILDKAVNHRWSRTVLDAFVNRITTNTIDLKFVKFMKAGLSSDTALQQELRTDLTPDTPRQAHFPTENDQDSGSSLQAGSSLHIPRPTANDYHDPGEALPNITMKCPMNPPPVDLEEKQDSSSSLQAGSSPHTPRPTANDYHDPGEEWPNITMNWARNSLAPVDPEEKRAAMDMKRPRNPTSVESLEIDISKIRDRLHLQCCLGDYIDV